MSGEGSAGLDDRGGSAARGETGETSLEGLMDSFVARARAGERPSVEEFAAAYPEHSEKLREVLPALLFVEEGRRGGAEEEAPRGPRAAHGVAWRIGEYRVLREIGRGGMGVVYEAEQESLGRRVALKLLPSRSTKDPRSIERFLREARAAAGIQHPHIVPVHAVGEAEGTHYYVMPLIAGKGLDDVLDEVRSLRGASGGAEGKPANDSTASLEAVAAGPGWSEERYFRNAARVGAQAASALAHAHRQGILHRDVKPSNLLLDGKGDVWLTDFGLAKAEDGEELTRSGELVGTLRYLAPERLRGWSDPRSDIYGLGLTLYEMLTLRPAFDDADRALLIRRIAEEEPPRPRKLDPHVPRDLETIVLKATAKEAGQRYREAGEMEEDLRRFLRGEPVLARSSGVWTRGAKWARRRPAAAALIAVICLAAVTIAAGSLRYGARLRAEGAHTRANFRRALEATNAMLSRVGDEGLAFVPQAEPVRRGLLEDALRLHHEFLEENPEDPLVRIEAARACRRVGEVYQLVGQRVEAREALAESEALLDSLAREFPGNAEYREELSAARSLRSLAEEPGLPAKGAKVSRFPVGPDGSAVVDVAAMDVDGDGRTEIVAANRGTSNVTVLAARRGREFIAGRSFPTGTDPYQMAITDLDGDGKADIVTMNSESRSASVLRGDGRGSFAKPETFPLEYQPWALVIADLDGNGRPEAAVAGGQTDVRVLRGKGEGFELGTPLETARVPNALAAADFDQDGHIDLAAGCIFEWKGKLSLLWNKGDGSFEERADHRLAVAPNKLLAIDLDGDGRIDLAATDYNGKSACVMRNAGARAFREGIKFTTGVDLGVAAADIDGDGDADLVTTNEEGGIVSLYLNAGDATFPRVVRFATGGGAFRGTAVEIDGDGRVDIAVANGVANDVAVLFHLRELLEEGAK